MKNAEWFVAGNDAVPLAVRMRHGVVEEIRLNGRSPNPPASRAQKAVARALQEYLAGERQDFDFPIGLHGSEFEMAVWTALQRIPYGTTVTYGELAARLGRPGSARAVGSANGRNPIPIVVPCHRVIAAGGKLGGYGGGNDLKRHLLDLEAGQLHLTARD